LLEIIPSFLLVLFFGEAKKRNRKKDFSFCLKRTARLSAYPRCSVGNQKFKAHTLG